MTLTFTSKLNGPYGALITNVMVVKIDLPAGSPCRVEGGSRCLPPLQCVASRSGGTSGTCQVRTTPIKKQKCGNPEYGYPISSVEEPIPNAELPSPEMPDVVEIDSPFRKIHRRILVPRPPAALFTSPFLKLSRLFCS